MLTDKCLDFGTNAYNYEQIFAHSDVDEDLFQLEEEHPEMFELPQLPSYWSFKQWWTYPSLLIHICTFYFWHA